MLICRICGENKISGIFKIREMMIGLRVEFDYFQCSKCKCLQISSIPKDIFRFYEFDYYSYKSKTKRNSLLKSKIINLRNNYSLLKSGFIGKVISKFFPNKLFELLSFIPFRKDLTILDIGCGSGDLLKEFMKLGFSNLVGIDPYLPKENLKHDKILFLKKDFIDLDQNFDIIMFHHSFEHMQNPKEVFKKIHKTLNSNGFCIIRIPIVNSYAWHKYQENWVQIDAPRHIFLHSLESINYLCAIASLKVEKIIFDSYNFQFLGSERYMMNIPLSNPLLDSDIFSKAEIKYYQQKAERLNKVNAGDSCAFIIKKIEN
jgi:2-polyprenyl-3-methyl-5-hydroxy-6-metoxy-1,4-benzoquinol methylase